MTSTGYSAAAEASDNAPATAGDEVKADHERLKKDYLAYLGNKTEEIKEQQDSRRYYHGSQWSKDAITAFKKRRQPVVTYNRIARKLNAVVGLLERQRQDPRGYPRTPKQEDGAEIATAVLRYVLDAQDWKAKSPVVGLQGAVDGLGGLEIILEQGDEGDVDIGFETVDPGAFFYDPRSLKGDFSDARYMGTGKWSDLDAAKAMFPDKAADLDNSVQNDTDLTSSPDSDIKWIAGSEGKKRVRIVDHWYIEGSDWHYCIYSGSVKLAEGKSYIEDEKGKTICKYIMYSANVDQDGDRYGFVRGMKSAQDEINQRRSKGLHILNSRRVLIEKGSVDDIEVVRTEAARPDGVIVVNPGTKPPEFDDQARGTELQGQLGFLEDARQEIENYGFNPALMGASAGVASGRALQIQQQSGIAELGPYLLGYKGWKLRVYRAIWNAAQQHWTAERWIRVTDDNDLAQFLAINQQQIDQATGQPVLVNALGSLDVDIIIDEGPDEINMQADAYDTMTTMARNGQQFPPEVIIELSPLPGSVKKKVIDMIEQAQKNPVKMMAMQSEMQAKASETAKNQSVAILNQAKAHQTLQPAAGAPDQGMQLAFDKWKTLVEAYVSIKVAEIGKGADLASGAMDSQIDAFLGLTGLANDQVMQLRDHAHQHAMQALLPPPQPASQPSA